MGTSEENEALRREIERLRGIDDVAKFNSGFEKAQAGDAEPDDEFEEIGWAWYHHKSGTIDTLRARLGAAEHELSLIGVDVEPFHTDCSTPRFIMVRNMKARLAEVERERDEARGQVKASMRLRAEEGAQTGEEYESYQTRITALEARCRDLGGQP